MLTFADVGQKKLRLKQGAFTADVVPQPVGKPMIVQTPSTVIEVVGTRFEVEALQSFTTVNVREGNVRLKHLVDGNSVNIPADYRVIAEAGGDLSPMPLPPQKLLEESVGCTGWRVWKVASGNQKETSCSKGSSFHSS